jgi:hypothetical protein
MDQLCFDVLIEIFQHCCLNEPESLLRFRNVCHEVKLAIDKILFGSISSKVEYFDIYGKQYFSNRLMKVGSVSWIPRFNQFDIVVDQDFDIFCITIRNKEKLYLDFDQSIVNLIDTEMTKTRLMYSLDLIFHPIGEYKKRLHWSWSKWHSLNFPFTGFIRCKIFPSENTIKEILSVFIMIRLFHLLSKMTHFLIIIQNSKDIHTWFIIKRTLMNTNLKVFFYYQVPSHSPCRLKLLNQIVKYQSTYDF